MDVWRSQALRRSEVTRSPASLDWSSRGSPAAERTRCGQLPRCDFPPLDAETPPQGGRSQWQSSHPPPALQAAYAWEDETERGQSRQQMCVYFKYRETRIVIHDRAKGCCFTFHCLLCLFPLKRTVCTVKRDLLGLSLWFVWDWRWSPLCYITLYGDWRATLKCSWFILSL